MTTGKRLPISGKGEPSPHGGSPGDITTRARLVTDPLYESSGYDLTITREMKLTEAILGTTLSVPPVTDPEPRHQETYD